MIKADAAHSTDRFVKQATSFVRDFAAFAGADGIRGAVLAVTAAVFESVGLVLLVPLLSIVTATNDSPGWTRRAVLPILDFAGAQTRTARLSLLLGIFATLLVVRAVIVARREIALAKLQMGFVEEVRARVAKRLAAAPWPTVSRLQHARITHLMSGDIQRIGSATSFTVQFLAALVLTVFQVGIAFLLAPALTAMALALIAIGVLVSFVMLGRVHNLGTQLSRTGIALMHETTQFLGGLKLAAGQNRQAAFVAEFEASLAALKQQQFAFIRRQSASRLAATVITGLFGALIILVGLTVFDTPPPILIAMLLVFVRIAGPVMQMSQAVQQFAHALPAYAEVVQLESDLAVTAGRGPRDVAAAIAQGPIVFRDVTFRHDDSRQSAAGLIVGLNLTVAPGSFVGVSGPTGAGKTTFADLLIGLLEPHSGEIAVGGTALRGATAERWRDHVSYVAQDPYLFRDTIRRNLLWASPQASEHDLWEALTIAGADDLVSGMESGLETVLGERGTLISGGERQRLCLARAVLRRPWLFVLDEATSAIDVATEQKILKRMLSLDPRPTIVMIAHRDESLGSCDRILRFQSGAQVTEAVRAT
jgi:ATP-binding cassette subfamily C protein